ncbi:MAG: D-tyrosyl-tRNA(Tyr) deacylase [Oscillochloris sp.]|nr:D-tyrosyl-tRNA(Tyr) deacylase [Oscillochloris sp.]
MRLVIQRVSTASVTVEQQVVGAIDAGLLILVGAAPDDGREEARTLAEKTAQLRIFSDAAGKFNLSLLDSGGAALVVSQFTLFADTRKGRRPSFVGAATPDHAEPLVQAYADALRDLGVQVAQGVFGAMMQVQLVNDGPVTIIIDSEELRRPRRSE